MTRIRYSLRRDHRSSRIQMSSPRLIIPLPPPLKAMCKCYWENASPCKNTIISLRRLKKERLHYCVHRVGELDRKPRGRTRFVVEMRGNADHVVPSTSQPLFPLHFVIRAPTLFSIPSSCLENIALLLHIISFPRTSHFTSPALPSTRLCLYPSALTTIFPFVSFRILLLSIYIYIFPFHFNSSLFIFPFITFIYIHLSQLTPHRSHNIPSFRSPDSFHSLSPTATLPLDSPPPLRSNYISFSSTFYPFHSSSSIHHQQQRYLIHPFTFSLPPFPPFHSFHSPTQHPCAARIVQILLSHPPPPPPFNFLSRHFLLFSRFHSRPPTPHQPLRRHPLSTNESAGPKLLRWRVKLRHGSAEFSRAIRPCLFTCRPRVVHFPRVPCISQGERKERGGERKGERERGGEEADSLDGPDRRGPPRSTQGR